MKEKEQYKRLLMGLFSTIIIVIQTALYGYIWYTYYSGIIPLPFWRKGNWVVIGLYAVILFFFSIIYGSLKVGYLRTVDIIYSQILTVFCVNIITYIQICLINRWFINLLPLIKLTVMEIFLIIIWVIVATKLYLKLYPPHKMLIIYSDRRPDNLVEKLTTRQDKYEICEMLHIKEGTEALQRKMQEYESVVLADIPAEYRNPLLKYCYEHSIRCYIHLKISDVLIRGADNMNLFDMPLLLARNSGLSIEQRFVKRSIDLVFSSLLILLTSPFMLIIGCVIKLYDKGPVFYHQERLTINGKRFEIYKFRSMRVDSEVNGAKLASKEDDRITPFGRFLRNIHFDELPQLFNVLKGDMTLVGPRPERLEIMNNYEKEIPEFPFRLKVKAGLTGYAQVYGKYNTTAFDKLKLDLYYIENYSLWLDFKLMLMTFKIMFQKEKSEGVDD